MKTVIYGKDKCPFCDKAKKLAEELYEEDSDNSYDYINIVDQGITKDDLSDMAGKPVKTVPQIFVNGKHIGGYEEYRNLVELF